jgi:hypothetical protein
MKLWNLLFTVATIFFSTGLASAADCSALAKWGIYDTSQILTDEQRVNSFSHWFCSHKFASYGEARSASAELGIPIDDMPVKLGWDGKDSSWGQWEESFCSSIAAKAEYRKIVSIYLKKVNEGALAVIKQCLTHPGLHAWLVQGAGERDFIIALEFQQFSTIHSATIKDILVSPNSVGTTCKPTLPLDAGHRVVTDAGLQVLCKRGVDDPILIAVNADQPLTVNGNLTLPEIPKPLQPVVAKIPPIKLLPFCATGAQAELPTAYVDVGTGYKIVGGGAKVNYGAIGNLLTASYPETATRWVARSKDHTVISLATITVCAIGLYDPNDEWDVQIVPRYSPAGADTNSVVAEVPQGYVLTGGGAAVDHDLIGQLLTASYPNGTRSWEARSKAHTVSRALGITAYAIGIRPRNGATPPVQKVFPAQGNPGEVSSGSASMDGQFLMTGGGAFADWKVYGHLLTESLPTGSGTWSAQSRAHSVSESVQVKVFAIGIQAPVTSYFVIATNSEGP